MIKGKKVRKLIHTIHEDDRQVNDQEGIANSVVRYYKQLFTTQGRNDEQWMSEIEFPKIEQDSNLRIIMPTENEVLKVVQSLNQDCAEGPNEKLLLDFSKKNGELLEMMF